MRGNIWLKRIDRFVGIPIIWLLSMLRRPRSFPERVVRIGILKEAAIGDTIMVSAGLSDIRSRYPNAKIILFAGPSNFEFAKTLTEADEVMLLPINRPYACMRVMRRNHLDLLIDGGQWPRINSILSWFSGALFTVGFKTAGQHRHRAYDLSFVHSAKEHEVDNFRRLFGLGVPSIGAPVFGVDCPPVEWTAIKKPYAVFHMWPGGTRSETKEWPIDNWIALARYLMQSDMAIVLTGAPADAPKNEVFIHAVLDPKDVINVAGSPISSMPSLLKGALLVVSVNTGMMHLAAVLDAPTIGLHGPTSSRRWGPLGKRAVSVVSDHAQSQYLNLGFEYKDNCVAMQHLPVAKVIQASEALLAPVPVPEKIVATAALEPASLEPVS